MPAKFPKGVGGYDHLADRLMLGRRVLIVTLPGVSRKLYWVNSLYATLNGIEHNILDFAFCSNFIVFHYESTTITFVISERFSGKNWALNCLSVFSGYRHYLNIEK